ncbi:cytochrome P450 [Microthyrium microscopicum]|uniref:Cytochrome P450 n=1 Tax=Microthyrium microscopicum TaxID=703497 RepID=A0A6A6U960_9PEZI|nr:cytochrome P450 [Microthyrium microscopicum]
MLLKADILPGITLQTVLLTGFGIFALLLAHAIFTLWKESTPVAGGFPIIGQEKVDLFNFKSKMTFAIRGRSAVEAAFKQFKNKPFQIPYHSGPALVLPIEQFDQIRNNPDLDMTGAALQDFFPSYPAFKPMRVSATSNSLQTMINKKLTPSLALITEPVNEENNIAIPERWPATKDWTRTKFVDELTSLISQVSSRIFLGAPLCRDAEWIRVGKDFTIDTMIASYAMRFTPSILRPIVYPFLPPVKRLERTNNLARRIIQPEVDKRRANRAAALAKGEKIPKQLDTIDWLDDVVKSDPNYDYVGAQLSLTFAAIHTTSNTLGHLMYDVIEHSELIPELRQEIIDAYTEDGSWQKTTLYKLKLMDSVMKESQRLNVLSNLFITRYAKNAVTLEDGTVIPKRTRVFFPSLHMQSEEYYPQADQFDGRRFLNLRNQPGNANKYQFVTTSSEHAGFGHGQHSCPGRFFASNEIKLIFAHLLMKFDWKFIDGRPANPLPESNERVLDQNAEILYKSRTPEINF